jgi:hypothetical protein
MRFIINNQKYERPVSKKDRAILADLIKREGGINKGPGKPQRRRA